MVLRPDFTKSHLLGEVDKLLADEEPAVRGVALETLSDMIPVLDDSKCVCVCVCACVRTCM